MLFTQLNQLEKVLTWVMGSRVWPLLRPAVSGLLLARRVVRRTTAEPVPVLQAGLKPEVLLHVSVASAEPIRRPKELEHQLWAGYSRYALPELERITCSRAASVLFRSEACWVLARWHTAHDEYEKGLYYALLMRSVRPAEAWNKGQVILEADCLNHLGREQEARSVLELVAGVEGWQPDYCLAYANTYGYAAPDADERLEWINRALTEYGFASVERLDPGRPIAIDNLAAPSARPGNRGEGPKVSVLMPAYNSATTIEKALRGLLQQTWQNLEIIPVDDCSTDDTWQVLQRFAALDSRIRPIKHQINTGAYGARLTALQSASGEFITVHDADDWSHPQKIEAQVEAMLANAELVATMSSWCRVSRNLYVTRVGVIPSANLQRQNESSLMFRRSLVDEIGAWDKVRAAADTEFIWRLQVAYGKQAVSVVHPEVPLSFSLSQEDSLTQTGPTHVKTIFYGTRRVYRETQRWWHMHASKAELAIMPGENKRCFPAPPNLLSKRPEPRDYDLLVVADFTMRVGVGQYVQSIVEAAIAEGLRVALFHWRRYEKPAMRPIRERYQALAAEGKIDIIAAEDKLVTQTAIVADAMVARHLLDAVPGWQAARVLIATGHTEGSGFPDAVEYDPEIVSKHVATAFGIAAPEWLPISSRDKALMEADETFVAVADFILPGLVPDHLFEAKAPQREARQPVVGRFSLSMGGSTWPDMPEELRQAYCADKPCKVRLVGLPKELDHAVGRLPANWEVDPRLMDREAAGIGTEHPELDFFLYYPGEEGLEAAGLALYEAMAVGQVVIASPEFSPLLEEAAVYADAAVVWPTVDKLWNDATSYQRQQELARNWVKCRCRSQLMRELVCNGETTTFGVSSTTVEPK
ncbi:glycosyltransferase family 2 protein [Litchfieldella rifensis]|uniref:Glycosyltransferase family 2 protein n=1 Tax=Litchfieldella rifensis TaxID=762643 RepID=A0ABV7LTU2_9GAMM